MNRAERRRQLKEDERLVARGLTGDDLAPVEVIALMRVLHDRLGQSRDAGAVTPLMAWFHDNMRAAGRAGPRKAIACRMGCAHCCHAWVSARAPEVLFVAASLPAGQRSAFRSAVDEAFAATGTLGPDARGALAQPCPLLRDSVCQAYGARPATCQTAVSMNAAVCGRAFQPGAAPEDIPTPDFYIAMRRGYSLALAGALKRAGFPPVSYEFNAALRAALARSDAEAAWLAGEQVFEGVQTEPGGDPFAMPRNRLIYDAAWADS